MSRVDVVRAAMVEAMKAKDKARKDSLSMLLSALKNAEIDKRSPLTEDVTEEQIVEVIKSVLAELGIENPAPSDKGKIMKTLMPKVKGKADGKVVNQVLAGILSK